MDLDEIECVLKGTDAVSEQKRLRIVRAIGMYSVGLFSIKKSATGDQLRLAGSGTLVQIEQSYFILTARHVWTGIRGWADQLGVTLRENLDHCHPIDLNFVTPIGPAPPCPFDETGPDIVLLHIPEAYAGAMKAFKVFYNLSSDERKRPSAEHIQTWFLTGVPALTGTYTLNHASVAHWGAEVGLLRTEVDGQHDFCDVNVNVSFLPPPRSIGGVSGGGLWKVCLFEASTIDGFDSAEALAGVAFWEFPLNGNCRTVRCQGTKSIRSLLSLVAKDKLG